MENIFKIEDDYEKEEVIVFINNDIDKGMTNLELGKKIEEFCEDSNYKMVKLIFGDDLDGALNKANFIVNEVKNARFVHENLVPPEIKLVIYDLTELASSRYELFTINYIFWEYGIMIDSVNQGRVISDDPGFGEIAFELEMYHRYDNSDEIQFKKHPRFCGGYYE